MNKVIVVVGPTAIGKTKISIELAKHYNLDVLSGDSVAIYKRLDIGSAKPTALEQQNIKHYFISELEPSMQYSVYDFQKSAREYIDNHEVSLICGGTGLYIQSVLFDYEFEAGARDLNLEDEYKDYSNLELYNYLLSLDPYIDKEKLHMNNRKRVLRAIEVIKQTNKPFSSFNNKQTKIYDYYIVYLNLKNRDVLYDRINKRVDIMMKEGLLEEVSSLYKDNITPHAIGYKEFIPYFEKKCTLEEVVEQIKQNSRHLAKRQITWFKNQMTTNFYEVDLENIDNTIKDIIKDIDVFLKG